MTLICTITQLKTPLFVVTWTLIVLIKFKYEVNHDICQLKTPLFLVTWTLIVVIKFKYEVNHDILLFILAPGYLISLNKVCWRFVVLTIYDRHRCQTTARYTGKFSSHLKVKLEFTLVLLNPELTLVLLNPFLETLDPDQLVSFRSHRSALIENKLNRIKFGRRVTV